MEHMFMIDRTSQKEQTLAVSTGDTIQVSPAISLQLLFNAMILMWSRAFKEQRSSSRLDLVSLSHSCPWQPVFASLFKTHLAGLYMLPHHLF